MNKNFKLALWCSFWILIPITWFVHLNLWMKDWQDDVLWFLAIVSLCIGFIIWISNEYSKRAFILVTLGLVIGQWWLVALWIMVIGWSFIGFAP
jgi:hypothetical protein